MSPRLPVVSARETTCALAKAGYAEISRSSRTVIVPMHRELAPGHLCSVLRQTDLTIEQFTDLL